MEIRELFPEGLNNEELTFLKEYHKQRVKMILLKPRTFRKNLYFNRGSRIRLIDYFPYFFESIFMEFSIEVDYEFTKFSATRTIQEYVDNDGHTFGFMQILDVKNPYESFVPSDNFRNKSIDYIKDELLTMHAVAENFYPDEITTNINLIERVYSTEDFLIEVFSKKDNLDDVIKRYSINKRILTFKEF